MSLERIIHYFPPAVQDLLLDDAVNEIMYNGDGSVWRERDGMLARVEHVPVDPLDVEIICQTIARLISKDVSREKPRLMARLADGSRVAAMLPPVSQDGPTLTIRKFSKRQFSWQDFLKLGSLTEQVLDVLRSRIGVQNILFSGQPGAGKTTLLNTALNSVDPATRVGIIEDTAEIRTTLPNVVRFESREAEDGSQPVTVRQLVKDSLRHRFDILVVGETRDESAYDLLQALNTGHQGSMSTIHANSPEDALLRLTDLAMSAADNLSERGVSRMVGRLIQVVIQVVRAGGRRYVSEVSEVQKYDPDTDQFILNPLYVFSTKTRSQSAG